MKRSRKRAAEKSAADGGSVIEPASTMLTWLDSGAYEGGFGWRKNVRMYR